MDGQCVMQEILLTPSIIVLMQIKKKSGIVFSFLKGLGCDLIASFKIFHVIHLTFIMIKMQKDNKYNGDRLPTCLPYENM